MRPYEVMIILDPSLDDDVIRAEVDRAVELVRSRGGTTGRVDRWGRRRLAYEIAHKREGYYVVLEATAEPAVMTELDRTLHLADAVIRHKVIRIAERKPRPPSTPPEAPGTGSSLAAETAASGTRTDANGA
ncbi:MAG TPA: 30S ribosomal protein S6 [Acidimicrobiales bacterium]|nr:30S ribosomal protein S6 [Acidimicrobiales bacterium]